MTTINGLSIIVKTITKKYHQYNPIYYWIKLGRVNEHPVLMKLLFWNTNGKEGIWKYIVSVVEDYDADIVILAELKNDLQINNKLCEYNNGFIKANTIGCNRINIWTSKAQLKPANQGPRHSIQLIDNSFILCCIHLQSDLHFDHCNERLDTIKEIMTDINELSEKTGLNRIIIIGDMNEMPYGLGCLSANGFHGLPALSVDEHPYRVVNGKEYRMYYNPMWNLFGDNSKPPGTYYLRQSRLHEPMWYILDQVIISQEVMPLFIKDSLKIINKSSAGRLDNIKGRPSVSDHFPILCEILEV